MGFDGVLREGEVNVRHVVLIMRFVETMFDALGGGFKFGGCMRTGE